MSSGLLAKWLVHYDPIHRGWTPGGIANGLCGTNGFFFPRIRGGYNLRRSVGQVPDAAALIVGAAGADATEIRTFPWVTHAASTTYVYRLNPINGGGVANWDDETITTAAFNPSGEWVGPRPNPPSDLRVMPTAGGKFVLRWTYNREGQQTEPSVFWVYHDGGTGEVDYDTIVAWVDYSRGRVHYDYTSGAFSHGARVQWAVRTVSTEGVAEKNEQVVPGWAEALAPPVNPTVVVTCE